MKIRGGFLPKTSCRVYSLSFLQLKVHHSYIFEDSTTNKHRGRAGSNLQQCSQGDSSKYCRMFFRIHNRCSWQYFANSWILLTVMTVCISLFSQWRVQATGEVTGAQSYKQNDYSWIKAPSKKPCVFTVYSTEKSSYKKHLSPSLQ